MIASLCKRATLFYFTYVCADLVLIGIGVTFQIADTEEAEAEVERLRDMQADLVSRLDTERVVAESWRADVAAAQQAELQRHMEEFEQRLKQREQQV